ncbi:hypothetical protein CEXT_165501 [Caerostris extrusa]|uniref:Uncharacterized protein n=1 Tax=Caerostris extrusa TaxID=172846 RepID=A0AAV4XZ72_CAEEX|nr:hypothetical protein CEXT_165501 [Caerostris extrusa]
MTPIQNELKQIKLISDDIGGGGLRPGICPSSLPHRTKDAECLRATCAIHFTLFSLPWQQKVPLGNWEGKKSHGIFFFPSCTHSGELLKSIHTSKS